jgi:hypothetical protein
VAEDLQLSPRIIDRLDQRAQSAIHTLVEALTEGQHINRTDYFRSLVRVIRAFIVQGGVTLLGRGAPFLVEEHEGLRVRMVAPEERRLKNIEEFYGLYGKEAQTRLAKGDAERAEFVRRSSIPISRSLELLSYSDHVPSEREAREIVLRESNTCWFDPRATRTGGENGDERENKGETQRNVASTANAPN